MATYATRTDVVAAAPADVTVPENLDHYLRSASRLVERATMVEVYPTNADGSPTDASLAAAFRDAVVLQVVYWLANGIDPAKGSGSVKGTGEVVSSSIGGGSITKATANTSVVADRLASLYSLVPAARDALPAGSGRPVVHW